MRNAVIHNDTPTVFRQRRFSDPVSPLNESIHDAARALAQAIEMVDGLGLQIISVEAERNRNKRIHVTYSAACDALGGVETSRNAEWSHWTANRFGVEIRWCIAAREVA